MVPRRLPSSLDHTVLLRTAGLSVWLILGVPALSASTRVGEHLSGTQWRLWIVLFLSFGAAFWMSSSGRPRLAMARVAALIVEACAALGATYLLPDYFVSFLLIVVAWQVAMLLPIRTAVIWVIVQTAVALVVSTPSFHMGSRWAAMSAYIGFQAFALVTAAIARSETQAREAEVALNAELASTRKLLIEDSRLDERMRIARELHDLLGHHLTALTLQLEVARHADPNEAREQVERAQATSRQLLHEVREVVTSLRQTDAIDVRGALLILVERVPRLRMHLHIPDDFCVTDSARAHALLRCVQEITTNTLKHADAANLWISIIPVGEWLEVTAQDDGQGVAVTTPGVGLSAMRERIEELGGSLSFSSPPDAGFTVRALLPAAGAAL